MSHIIIEFLRFLQMPEIIFSMITINYEIAKCTLWPAAFNYWTKALGIDPTVDAAHPCNLLIEVALF